MAIPDREKSWITVWDLPTRVFHWSLAILVGTSIYTGLDGGLAAMEWHMRSGYAILVLLLFRLAWGFAGTRHARFRNFIRGPRAVLHYLGTLGKYRRTRNDDIHHPPGHNPAGGWMVVLMLVVLAGQAVTGLFATDDVFLEGPLAYLADAETQSLLTSIHHLGFEFLLVLIGLHVAAILLYWRPGRIALLPAMLHGRKRQSPDSPEPGIGHHRVALALTFVIVATVVVVTALGLW